MHPGLFRHRRPFNLTGGRLRPPAGGPDAAGPVWRQPDRRGPRDQPDPGQDGEICFSNPLGPGPAPDPAHLFDRFYQSSPARGKGGAGLGLSIVRELMEQMGGRVSAQAADNKLHIKLRFSTEGEEERKECLTLLERQ